MVSLFNMLCAQQHQWVVMRHAAFFFFFPTKKIWSVCLNSKRQWLVSIHLIQLSQIEHQPFGWVKHFIGGECSTFYWIKTRLSLTDNYSRYRSNKAQHPRGKKGHLLYITTNLPHQNLHPQEKCCRFVDKSKIEIQWPLKEMEMETEELWKLKNKIK